MAFFGLSRARLTAAVGVGVSAAALAVIFTRRNQVDARTGIKRAYEKFSAMADYPDLRHHNNVMAKHLTPRVYSKLRDKSTASGFTIDQAIQTGVDNPGHPFISTVGIVAGDEEPTTHSLTYLIPSSRSDMADLRRATSTKLT